MAHNFLFNLVPESSVHLPVGTNCYRKTVHQVGFNVIGLTVICYDSHGHPRTLEQKIKHAGCY